MKLAKNGEIQVQKWNRHNEACKMKLLFTDSLVRFNSLAKHIYSFLKGSSDPHQKRYYRTQPDKFVSLAFTCRTGTAIVPKTKSTQNGRYVSNLFNSMFQTFNLVLPLLRFLVALRPKVS